MDDPTSESARSPATPVSLSPQAGTADLLFSILESLPFRVYAYDLDGVCVLQNSVSLLDFGSMVGRHASELPVSPESYERWTIERQRALAGEVVWGEQEVFLCGQRRIFEYAIAPIWSNSTISGTVGIDIDVTDQRRTEVALRELHKKLRAREGELAHLDRLSTMGQMASELAHELSQPLYAITNFAEACLALVNQPGELNRDDLRRWLEQIAGQARRGGDGLKRMTRYVRKGEMIKERTDLNDRIRNCLAMLELELTRHRIQVDVQLSKAPLWMLADALLIEQVLVNLIRNAEDAMDHVPVGDRVLTVSSFAKEQSVGAAISDTGSGIGPGTPNHLFEPYHTTKVHGTGLGLPICRTTIEAHGGRIWAEPNPTGGATFQFQLPAAD